MDSGGRICVLHLRAASGGGGGPEKTILKTAQLIDKAGFDCRVLYLKKADDDIGAITGRYAGLGLRCDELSGGSVDIGLAARLAAYVRRHRVDIIHSHDPKTDIYALLTRILVPRVKLVSTLHGWIIRRARSGFYARLSMAALRRFDVVIAVSMALRDQALAAGLMKVEVVHNGIDLSEWRSDRGIKGPGEPFTVLYCGRVSMEKGSMEFVEIAGRVMATDAGFRFVVAGEGPMLGEMKAAAERKGIAQAFEFRGRVGGEAIRTLYEDAGALLSPSLTEGLPNNILEACATMTPVVATDVGGVAEILEDGKSGIVKPVGAIESLAEALLAVKRDAALAEGIAREARRKVEQDFSFDGHLKKTESLYRNLAGYEPAAAVLMKEQAR